MHNLDKLVLTFMNDREVTLDGDMIRDWRYTTAEEGLQRLIVRVLPSKDFDFAQRVEYPVMNIRRVGVFTSEDTT